jgi:hypothetical protein
MVIDERNSSMSCFSELKREVDFLLCSSAVTTARALSVGMLTHQRIV